MNFLLDLGHIFVLFLHVVQHVDAQELLASGSTLSLGGSPYYVPGKAVASGHKNAYAACSAGSRSFALGLVPITVVNPDINSQSA